MLAYVVKLVRLDARVALLEKEFGDCHWRTASFWGVMSAVEVKRPSVTRADWKVEMRVCISVEVVAIILYASKFSTFLNL